MRAEWAASLCRFLRHNREESVKNMEKLKKIIYYKPEYGTSLRRAHYAFNGCALLAWALIVTAVSLCFSTFAYGGELYSLYFARPLIFALNALPVLALALVLFFAVGRLWISMLITGLFAVILSIVNYFKLHFRGDPVLVSDIIYINESADMGGNYEIAITPLMICAMASAVIFAALAFFFLRLRVPGATRRLAGLAAALALFAGVVFLCRSEGVYTATENLLPGQMSSWSATDRYVSRGVFYPLIYETRSMGADTLEGYDPDRVEALFAGYADGEIAEESKVHIVAVMLEGFADFSDLVPLKNDPYAALHALESESVSGNLLVNVFAGDTIDTERAFLTGNTKKIDFTAPAGSYVRYLEEQGYVTEFAHPSYGAFYYRDQVAEHLGFDSWLFTDNYFPDEGVMPDAVLMPMLYERFKEQTAGGERYFQFSVTYQNHGPYEDDTRLYEVEYFDASGVSEGAGNALNNYLGGVNATSEAMAELVDSFRDESEPVVVVFFGDHKPWMGNSLAYYRELGISFYPEEETGFYNHYATPYLIWANDAAKAVTGNDFTGEGRNISPCFLMTEVFDLCGYEGDAFMQAGRELREKTPLVHKSGAVLDAAGLITRDVPADTAAVLEKYLLMQQYRIEDMY